LRPEGREMQILTYPVGVVVGILPLVVELGVPPKPASLLLDGKTACSLTAEAPGCSVDFGAQPRIHLLELVRRDASGRVVERSTRWVNRPGADQAEVQTQTACPPGAATCTVLIGWAHPERMNPSRIRAALDGKPVSLPKDRTLAVPARALRGTLLTVELAFPDDRRATYAGAVGGRTHGDESVDLAPMLHEGTCDAERLGEVVRRYEAAKVGLRAVEPGDPGDWQLTFVAEPSVLETLRVWFEEKKAPLIGPKRILVPDSIAGAFGGAGNVVALTGVVAGGALQEFDLLQAGSPNLWVERLAAALRGAVKSGARTADAAAATGFHAGAAPRKRAVVLLLGNVSMDASVLPAAGVRRYLGEVRVPFEAWNLTPIDRPDWPGARRVATPADLYDSLVALRRRISCQSIAWVEADFRTASAAARAADPALMRIPDAPTPVVPAEEPSDDVTRRTLEKVRAKEKK
jgi:hypothetical protein